MNKELKLFIKRKRLHYRYRNIKKTGIAPDPICVVIEPTMKCNLRCKMCYLNFTSVQEESKKEMTLEEMKTIVDKFPKSVKMVNLIGGEPFLREDTYKLIRHILSKKLKLAISTNLTILKEEEIKNLSEENLLKKIFFSVSLDGKQEVHDEVRGKGKFALMKKNVELLQKYGHTVERVNSVLLEDNFKNLKEIVETVAELKLKNLIFEHEYTHTKNMVDYSAEVLNINKKAFPIRIIKDLKHGYTLEELKQGIEEAEKRAKELGIKLNYYPNDFKEHMKDYYDHTYRNNKKLHCSYFDIARINPEGQLIGCYLIREPFVSLKDCKTFEEAWNCKNLREYRKRLTNHNLVPLCDVCLYMV